MNAFSGKQYITTNTCTYNLSPFPPRGTNMKPINPDFKTFGVSVCEVVETTEH